MAAATLLESIQHVFIKKLAVNSGGKHCLALSAEGEVYSWGEGEDGKLGHGNRRLVSRLCLLSNHFTYLILTYTVFDLISEHALISEPPPFFEIKKKIF